VESKKPKDIKQRTFEFALEVVRLCRKLDERSWVARTIGKQLLRSGTSIGANIEEAQAGQSRADFINKYSIALKEARETIYWLRLLSESDKQVDNQIEKLQHEAGEITKILGSIIVNAKKNVRSS